MTGFDDRRNNYENKFALDADLMFRAEARCCKIIGLWAAEHMGLKGDDATAYSKEVVAVNLEEAGFEDVKRKLAADFEAHNVSISEHLITKKIDEVFFQAQKEIYEEAN